MSKDAARGRDSPQVRSGVPTIAGVIEPCAVPLRKIETTSRPLNRLSTILIKPKRETALEQENEYGREHYW
jgi:hypothetical protein